jgi:hypothetical protein
MILAPDKRFIFIHVPKAAGTSINAALSLHDAFFPVRQAKPDARRARAEKLGLSLACADLGEHATARQFIVALGRETYDGYFSFAFVRNPWDVAVSWFHYRLINPAVNGHAEAQAAGTFAAYVRRHLTQPDAGRWVGLQHPFVADESGDVAVSFIGRYESLAGDYAAVIARLQVPTLELDHFNQSYHAPWPSLYTRETFAIVQALVARDAELFGYSKDPMAYGIA